MATRMVAMGAAGRLAAPVASDILSPAMQRPLASLLSQAYGKPVELNITKLSRPYLDSSLFAAVIAQRLKDRKLHPRRVLREAVWKAPLPTSNAQVPSMAEHAAIAVRALRRKPSLRSVGRRRTQVAKIIDEMKLKRVSSLFVSSAGRLGQRMTANRADFKEARKGLSAKGPGPMMRGVRPLNVQYAFRAAKRRVGAYGIKASVGHS